MLSSLWTFSRERNLRVYRRSKRQPDEHFRTDHLMGNLARRSVHGSVVTIGAQALNLALQVTSTVTLARILTPTDFGRVAMVTVLTTLISQFCELGLSAATVQRRHIGHSQASTLFWVNMLLGVLMMLGTAAAAPLIARFYGDRALAGITLALAGTFLFSGLAAQHMALLRRQMRYRTLATIDVASTALGVAAGIAVALMGGRYWALVATVGARQAAMACLANLLSGWWPSGWHFDRDVREMLRFGRNLTGYNLLNYVSRNADNVLIGRFIGAADLGIYSKAYSLLLMPIRHINGPLAGVAIPVLSRLQSDPKGFRRYYLKIVQTIGYVCLPGIVVLWVLADEAVLIALGPQWSEAAEIFRIFALFVIIQNLANTTGWVLQAMGRTGRQLKWGAVQAPTFVLACCAGLPWGITGVAWAVTIQGLVMGVVSMLVAYHGSPVGLRDVAVAMIKPAALTMLTYLLAEIAHSALLDRDVYLRVASTCIVAGAGTLIILTIFPPIRDDVRQIGALMRRQ